MTDLTSAERERQRFEHLVLGRHRPKGATSRRVRRKAAPVVLAPGVEERVQLRERWSHKAQGTPETHEHHAAEQKRPGAIARLWNAGTIGDDHLDAAERIASSYWAIARDVIVRTASLEARVDSSGHGRAEEEAYGAVLADLTYDAWRRALGPAGDLVLAVVVHDTGLTIAARRHGMSMPRARRVLIEALDLWWVARGVSRTSAKAIVEAA